MLVNKIKETEAALWYNNKKEFGRMANMRPPKYCKPCNSRTHNESECWGKCKNCGQRNHQSKHCRYKKVQQQQQANPQPVRADKAATKGKKKRNRRAGKRATVNNSDSRRESKEEEEASEEESPRKADPPEVGYRTRSARLNYGQTTYRDLNEQLSNLKEEEKKELSGRFKAYSARIARNEDTSVVQSTVHSKITGGKALTLKVLWTLAA